jgi:hypothetical protein
MVIPYSMVSRAIISHGPSLVPPLHALVAAGRDPGGEFAVVRAAVPVP